MKIKWVTAVTKTTEEREETGKDMQNMEDSRMLDEPDLFISLSNTCAGQGLVTSVATNSAHNTLKRDTGTIENN